MAKSTKPNFLNIANPKSIFYGETIESWDSVNSIDWTIADLAALAKRHSLGGNLNYSDSLRRAWDCLDYTNQLAVVKQWVKIRATNITKQNTSDKLRELIIINLKEYTAQTKRQTKALYNRIYKEEYLKQLIDLCNRIECLGTLYPLTQLYFLLSKEVVNH